jgi:dihydrofolate reductase
MTTTQQRRLRQSCLVSVNGVFSEPLAWAGPYFGPGSAALSLAALEDSGALLMGRRTYEIFSRQWPAASGEYAAYLNEMPKYVFSSSLQSPSWTNTAVISGDVVAAVTELKREAGKDLIVYGHGRLGQTLCDAGLVDQLTGSVPPIESGLAAGANNTVREAGGVVGVAVLAAVFAANGGYDSPASFMHGFKAAEIVAAVVAVVGALVAALAPGRPRVTAIHTTEVAASLVDAS